MEIFFASFSKSQSTNWTTIGVNKQFFNTLEQSRLSLCVRQSFKVSLDTPELRSKSRVSSTRARAIICATRRNFSSAFCTLPDLSLSSFFSCRRKQQRPTSCDVDNINVELRLWLLAENKHGIDSIVKTIKGTWLKSKDYYKARDDTVHKADDNLLQCSIDLTDLLRLKDFTTGRQFPNHVS